MSIQNFRPIPTITVANDYWENKKWRFNIPEITVGAGATPQPIVVTVSGIGAVTLVNAIDKGLLSLTLFGGTEQRNLPSEYTQVNYVTNTAKTWLDTGVKFDFSKNYEIEIRARGTTGSWYIFQARGSASAPTYGISGSQTGNTIILGFNGSTINTSQVSRVAGNIYYVKGTINNGTLTLYVKDETAGTEETVTGTYTVGTGQSVNIGLFGNGVTGQAGLQAVEPNSDVYFARIKEDDNYILNYVPCNQNTTAGFYNKASGTFKTTTDLSAGTDAVPSPDTPMDIVCNNGVIKVSKNLFDYEYFYDNYQLYSPSSVGRCPIKLQPNTTYTVSTNEEASSSSAKIFVVSGNAIDWTPNSANNGILVNSPRTVTTDSNGYLCLGFYVLSDNAIPKSDFENGTVWIQIEQGSSATPYKPYGTVYTDGTTETVEVTGNLVDFNETRINSSTWDSADKTKGFEVYADVYQKAVGDSMLSNANAFGVFVPCKQGESISLNFFDYEPFYSRCLYCEITADRKCNTTPQAYDNASAIIQKTFTLTQSDSIGFVIEWYISGERVRNYTKENYTVINGQTPPTSYIPYFNGGSATAEMLLKVGDYKDVQEVLAGNVTRNIGIKVLDGTENWTLYSGDLFSTSFNNRATGTQQKLLCTHLNTVTKTPAAIQTNEISCSGTYRIIVRKDDIPTIEQFKSWLADQYNAGTPVIVVYPLAESTTETVTGQPLSIQAGTNIITAEGSIDNLSLEVSYKAGVAVTITEIENAQLDNSVEVTIQ